MKRLFNVRWIVFYLIALAAGILTAWVGLFYGKLLPLLLLSLSLPVMILSLAFLFWPVKRRIFLWIQAHALRILSVCLLLLVGYVSFNFQFIQVQNRSLPQGTYQVTGRISDLWTEDGGEYSVTGMILDRVSLNDGRSSLKSEGGSMLSFTEQQTPIWEIGSLFQVPFLHCLPSIMGASILPFSAAAFITGLRRKRSQLRSWDTSPIWSSTCAKAFAAQCRKA